MGGIFLMLDLKGQGEFDTKKICNCLRNLPGIRNWNESGARYPFFCEFDFGSDSTIVHMLANDLQFISVEGVGDASLQVSLELQKCYGEEIYAIDPECWFAFPLSEVTSLSDFREKMESGLGHEHLEGD